MSDVDTIRLAAALMRQRAEAARYDGDRWAVDVAGPLAMTAWLGPSHDVLTATWPQAAHVEAISRPPFALAIADWLDTAAEREAEHRKRTEHHAYADPAEGDEAYAALLVARAYLRDGA